MQALDILSLIINFMNFEKENIYMNKCLFSNQTFKNPLITEHIKFLNIIKYNIR